MTSLFLGLMQNDGAFGLCMGELDFIRFCVFVSLRGISRLVHETQHNTGFCGSRCVIWVYLVDGSSPVILLKRCFRKQGPNLKRCFRKQGPKNGRASCQFGACTILGRNHHFVVSSGSLPGLGKQHAVPWSYSSFDFRWLGVVCVWRF